jgi:hypothetical protein
MRSCLAHTIYKFEEKKSHDAHKSQLLHCTSIE